MKALFFLASTIVLFSCEAKEATPEFQPELFAYIKTNGKAHPSKCETAFSTLRSAELTVFCHPPSEEVIAKNMGEMDLEAAKGEVRETIKHETTSLIIKWAQETKRDLKSIQTRFTDEIQTAPSK